MSLRMYASYTEWVSNQTPASALKQQNIGLYHSNMNEGMDT